MHDNGSVTEIDQQEFLEDYLAKNKPLVVRGESLRTWSTPPPWKLSHLAEKFGDRDVPVFDTLFEMQRVVKFGDYVAMIENRQPGDEPVPYLRWYARQRRVQVSCADSAFAELSQDWRAPSWLPAENYVFPTLRQYADPVIHSFPAKGIFICDAGGRTRMHADPWGSDAVLCQVTGRKRFLMYPPESGDFLRNGDSVVDIENPDDDRFPQWRSARVALDATLQPGDTIFIPAGWYHTAVALEPSVSITWNFVHESSSDRFAAYVESDGATDPTIQYFARLADPA